MLYVCESCDDNHLWLFLLDFVVSRRMDAFIQPWAFCQKTGQQRLMWCADANHTNAKWKLKQLQAAHNMKPNRRDLLNAMLGWSYWLHVISSLQAVSSCLNFT